MFIAMNRFQVVKGSEEAFERMWQGRDSYLNEMAGLFTSAFWVAGIVSA